MPVIHAAQTVVHRMHGTSFTSYATPARGSKELCAWRIEIPGRTEGVPHRVSREEVLFILSGTIRATVDDRCEQAAAGDVVLVPAGSRFGVDNLTDEPRTPRARPTAGFPATRPPGHDQRRFRGHPAGRLLAHSPLDPLTRARTTPDARLRPAPR